jgi:CheY-like chemotaxis protein
MRLPQIVLIEDNPGDVLLVEMALRESGVACALTKFGDGQEAVRVLCGEPTAGEVAPDAILLDLNTPRTDGFEALRSFRQTPHLAQVPIAILTSSRAHADKQRAESQGARYIEKPSQLREFLTTVGHAVKEMLAGADVHKR